MCIRLALATTDKRLRHTLTVPHISAQTLRTHWNSSLTLLLKRKIYIILYFTLDTSPPKESHAISPSYTTFKIHIIVVYKCKLIKQSLDRIFWWYSCSTIEANKFMKLQARGVTYKALCGTGIRRMTYSARHLIP